MENNLGLINHALIMHPKCQSTTHANTVTANTNTVQIHDSSFNWSFHPALPRRKREMEMEREGKPKAKRKPKERKGVY